MWQPCELLYTCYLLWTGEDGTELSAAGQMETVLGVSGLDQALHTLVLSVVLKIVCFNPVPSPSKKTGSSDACNCVNNLLVHSTKKHFFSLMAVTVVLSFE